MDRRRSALHPQPRWPTSTARFVPAPTSRSTAACTTTSSRTSSSPNLADYLAGKDVSVYNFEYLLNYTNASYLLDPAYAFDPQRACSAAGTRRPESIPRQLGTIGPKAKRSGIPPRRAITPGSREVGVPEFTTPTIEHPKRDMTLSDPMCVPAVQEALLTLRP